MTVLFLCLPLYASDAHALVATDTLTFYVGCFGGPYYKKAEYNWLELYNNLNLNTVAYSYTNGERFAVVSAKGFYITDLLDYANISFDSAAAFDFYTADQSASAFTSFTKSELFGTARYYFEELPYKYVYDSASIWDGACEVEPMLAIEDNFAWFDAGVKNAKPNFNSLGTSNRFRLCFGQTDPQEARTNQSAKMVHSVYITLFGYPNVSADETNITLSVGDLHTLRLNIMADDAVIAEHMLSDVVWRSDSDAVVSVDSNGVVTATGEGTANIYADVNGTTTVFTVTVGTDSDSEPDTNIDTDTDTETLSEPVASAADVATGPVTDVGSAQAGNISSDASFDGDASDTQDTQTSESDTANETDNQELPRDKINNVVDTVPDKAVIKTTQKIKMINSAVFSNATEAAKPDREATGINIREHDINRDIIIALLCCAAVFTLGVCYRIIRNKTE